MNINVRYCRRRGTLSALSTKAIFTSENFAWNRCLFRRKLGCLHLKRIFLYCIWKGKFWALGHCDFFDFDDFDHQTFFFKWFIFFFYFFYYEYLASIKKVLLEFFQNIKSIFVFQCLYIFGFYLNNVLTCSTSSLVCYFTYATTNKQ